MNQGKSQFFVGLDLGPPGQFTALAVLEQSRPNDTTARAYALRHLERFAPGTPYGEIVEKVRDLLRQPLLKRSVLVADRTGVGRPVMDLLKAGLQGRVECLLVTVTLTTGHKTTRGGSAGFLVPKNELVGSLQLLLQARRLQVARSLPNADLLVRELEAFRYKPSLAGGEAEAAWRESANDDLVFAAALAGWVGAMG